MSDDRETFKTSITQVTGMIFISLPDDQYIELTPNKARIIATKLFTLAAEAEGNDPPQVIVFAPDALTGAVTSQGRSCVQGGDDA